MHAEEQHVYIKWLLRMRGTSLASIARSLEVKPSAVTIVSKGRGRSKRIEAAIAEATGLSLDQLWPDNYEKEGD